MPARARAFSLIELTMVVLIVGIAAAIVTPRWTEALGRYRADAAARRIVADLALTQAFARSSSAPQTVIFNPTSNFYRLVGMSNFESVTTNYNVYLANAPYLANLSSTDFVAATPLTFNAFGVPSAGGTLTVTSGGYSRTITIDPDSGVATIQ